MAVGLDAIVAGQVELLATGFQFTEGPLWHPDGFWLFVDTRTNTIHKLRPGGEPEDFRTESGRTNGLTFDADGRVLMCEAYGRRLSRREHDGSITTVVDRWEGRRLNRPNDLIMRSDGTVFFTDPEPQVDEADRELGFSAVFRVRPDGSVRPVVRDVPFPNGLALSPDEATLYLINTREPKVIWAYPLDSDANLREPQKIIDMSTEPGDGVPDGMKVDSEGRLYGTGPGGLWIMESSGEVIGIVEVPEQPSNCAFGGDDYGTLFITARTSVYALRLHTRGVVPPGARR